MQYADGNSQACRLYHAVLSRLDRPELHCPHTSLNTTDADPDGKVKCSVSENVQPSDLFAPSDFEKYATFCVKVGIDPDLGYQVVSSE